MALNFDDKESEELVNVLETQIKALRRWQEIAAKMVIGVQDLITSSSLVLEEVKDKLNVGNKTKQTN